jgi:hypothetical protein
MEGEQVMRSMRRARIRGAGVVAVIGLAALTGCGGGDAKSATSAQPAASGGGVSVSSTDLGLSPAPSPTDPGPSVTSSASSSTAPVPWDTGALPAPASVSMAASGPAKLSLLLDDGFGLRSTWTLTCDPAGGTHPHPVTACGVLGASGAKALPAPAANTACTEQYGGPQKAKITGTWRGKAVNAELSLENGCQITRWTALLGLLPPGGVKQ